MGLQTVQLSQIHCFSLTLKELEFILISFVKKSDIRLEISSHLTFECQIVLRSFPGFAFKLNFRKKSTVKFFFFFFTFYSL